MSADHDTGQDRTPRDAALAGVATVVIRTSRFGDLDLDPCRNQFEGRVDWDGEAIKLLFNIGEHRDLEHELSVAEQLWDAQAEWIPRVEAFAVQRLLPVKNDTWLEDDETSMTAEQFLAEMELVAIAFDPEGSFGFQHNAGNLFGDHGIKVSGSLKDGLTRAAIV